MISQEKFSEKINCFTKKKDGLKKKNKVDFKTERNEISFGLDRIVRRLILVAREQR